MNKEKKRKCEQILKPIDELRNSIGWVSFTRKQMIKIGINPCIHTSRDLRDLVFKTLKIRKDVKK